MPSFRASHWYTVLSAPLVRYPLHMAMTKGLIEKSRRTAIVMLRLESLILIALIIYLALLDAFRSHPLSAPLALAGDFIGLVLGAIGLFACSISYARRKSWGRAPAVLANLIALGVAYFMASGSFYIGAIPLGILGFVTAAASLLGYDPESSS